MEAEMDVNEIIDSMIKDVKTLSNLNTETAIGFLKKFREKNPEAFELFKSALLTLYTAIIQIKADDDSAE